MPVSLFVPCFNDALFPETAKATVRILERLGHEVLFPQDQTCCGQIHYNSGYRKDALKLLQRFVSVFQGAEVVVAPSASCVAMVREQYPDLAAEAGSGAFVSTVRELGARTFELSEYLVNELGVEDVGAFFPYKVALHQSCHSIRGIRVGDAPAKLLDNVRGLERVELKNSDECCGFGGTFAVKNADTSLAMLNDKMVYLRESDAQVLTAVDNSCLLHIAGGLHRIGAPTHVLHLAEILAAGGEQA